VVHDGFSTATAETDDVDLPERPPSVAILAPADGEDAPGRAVSASLGAVNMVDGTPLDDPDASWAIDDDTVGEGLDVWIPPLSPGTHRVALLSHGIRIEQNVEVAPSIVRGD
jgi:hypothetical protein